MADIPLSTINESGSGVIKLAPDLTYPSNKTGNDSAIAITGIDGSSGLVTALSLTGKFAISKITFSGFAAETSTVKLTIDGVVIWDDEYSTLVGTTNFLGGSLTGTGVNTDVVIQCDSTFLLEISTTADNSVDLTYLARPLS